VGERAGTGFGMTTGCWWRWWVQPGAAGASWCQRANQGEAEGNGTHTWRTPFWMRAPTVISRSRKVLTWARARSAPATSSRIGCISTYAAASNSSRNWFAQERWHDSRSVFWSSLRSVIPFCGSPR